MYEVFIKFKINSLYCLLQKHYIIETNTTYVLELDLLTDTELSLN